MESPLVELLLWLIILYTLRVALIMLHELGHAIPTLILTRKKVTIFIGPNRDPGINFRIGLLTFCFTKQPLYWAIAGLCQPSAFSRIQIQIIYILCGPLVSLAIAISTFYVFVTYHTTEFYRMALLLTFIISGRDFLASIIPRQISTINKNSWPGYNDGYLLKKLFSMLKFSSSYNHAVKLYEDENYVEAGPIFKSIIDDGFRDNDLYRLAIASYLKIKNMDEVKALTNNFLQMADLNSNDYLLIGYQLSIDKLFNESIEALDKALAINPKNEYALCNKGYVLCLLERYGEAIVVLDKAIEVNKNHAYSYNNRGFAKIKTNKLQEGLDDINHSLKLDPKNAYAYRNLGIYHLALKEYPEALTLFEKAKKMDGKTDMIEELILSAQASNDLI